MTYTSVLKEKIAQDYVQKVSSAFNATVSPVARETWLSNYVEYSLASVVGLDQLSLLPRLIDVDVVSCGILYSKKCRRRIDASLNAAWVTCTGMICKMFFAVCNYIIVVIIII